MSYLTYEEYQNMGGQLSDSAFTSYLWDVESKLNYLTNNRIKNLEEIPEAVKRLVFKLVSLYDSSFSGSETAQLGNLSSYSNGIESFSYNTSNDNGDGSTSFDNRISSIIKEYLSEYPELLYRGRNQWKQKL